MGLEGKAVGRGGWWMVKKIYIQVKKKKTSIVDIVSGVISFRVKVTSSSW